MDMKEWHQTENELKKEKSAIRKIRTQKNKRKNNVFDVLQIYDNNIVKVRISTL